MLVVILLLVGSCRDQQIVRAKVFERKQLEGARLAIKYFYIVNGNKFTDSAIIKNTVVGTDSINLIIDPSQPGRSIPDLQNK